MAALRCSCGGIIIGLPKKKGRLTDYCERCYREFTEEETAKLDSAQSHGVVARYATDSNSDRKGRYYRKDKEEIWRPVLSMEDLWGACSKAARGNDYWMRLLDTKSGGFQLSLVKYSELYPQLYEDVIHFSGEVYKSITSALAAALGWLKGWKPEGKDEILQGAI